MNRHGFAFIASLYIGLGFADLLLAAEKIVIQEIQEVGGKIKWVYDYAAGKALAQSTGKPMFVVFRCER